MKFSLQSKSSAKPKPIKPLRTNFDDGSNNDHQDSKQLQYITEFDASKTLASSNEPKIPVIAPIPNEWKPHKKMKNLELPITSQSGAPGALSFELESQAPSVNGADSKISYGLNVREKFEYKDGDERPRSTAPVPVEAVMLQKLKDDLDRLPEDRGMEEFDDVPVESFAAALLAGYGWQKGRGIGRNAKEDVKVVEYEKRTDKHGLGFINSDKRDKEEAAKAKGRDTERRSSNAGKKSSRSKVEEEEEEPKKAKAKKSGQVSWLKSHIRVRIISKELKGGRLYLKKGEVVDVVGPMTCDVSMDESRELIQGVSQDLLETALPRRGGPVLVLYGKHEGVYGNLVRKDSEQESGLVQDANNHELLHVPLEQIAEYIGDPSCLGY